MVTLRVAAALILSVVFVPAGDLNAQPSDTPPTITAATLAAFTGNNGSAPDSLILASDGNFYGTAMAGSAVSSGACGFVSGSATQTGCGTIFKITPDGTLSVLHSFSGVGDGSTPLSIIEGGDGNLYGSTVLGGSGTCQGGNQTAVTVGCGTIFKITRTGSFSLLHSFTAGADGAFPTALIQGSDGDFYGTTVISSCPAGYGSLSACLGFGTVFRMTLEGAISTLYEFTGLSDGGDPASLVEGSDGNFYGFTQFGGANGRACQDGCGTVFQIAPSGSLSTIYSFGESGGSSHRHGSKPEIVVPQPGHPTGSGGANQYYDSAAALIEDGAGQFIFAESFGLSGVQWFQVSTITPLGQHAAIYISPVTAELPQSLIVGGDGLLYGTTPSTVFQIDASGNFTTIYSASSAGSASLPLFGSILQGGDGSFYTTAGNGGPSSNCGNIPNPCFIGYGSIVQFSLSPSPPAPVHLSLDASSFILGESVTLDWTVLNGFSTTLQQCYAFVNGDATGAGNWAGLQVGAVSGETYAGTASIRPTAKGYYTYALTCGGQESGFTKVAVGVPQVMLSSTSFDFGSLPAGTRSAAQTVRLFNQGVAPLTITSIAASAQFTEQNNCPASLAPATFCSIAVSFVPIMPGSITGSLTLKDNGQGGSQTIALSGSSYQIPQSINFAVSSPVNYGVAPITLSATGGSSGNQVKFSVISGPGSISDTRLTITGVGTVVVAANQAGSIEYSAAPQVTQNVVVNQGMPKITWATPAAINYGTKLSATQLNANSTTPGTFTYSPAIGAVPGAGSQTLTAAFTPKDAVDYATVNATVTLVVKPVQLTVTAANASRTYGAANPSLAAAYTGFVNSDSAATALTGNPILATTATATSAPGTYPITVAAGSLAAANYSFKFVNGTLTVTKAPLTVTAINVSVIYNQAIPKLTYSVAGFANSDTSSILKGTPTETTTAKQGSNYGAYPIAITQGTLAANSDYSFQFVNGTLTITPLGTTATPTFTPGTDTSTSALSISITDATNGAAIYYTTSGTTPTTSSTKYTAAIKVAATETLQAIAVAAGYAPSAVATAAYVIATAPTAATKSATGMTSSSATLNGTVTANNATTQYWFAYGTSKTSLSSNTAKTGGLTGSTVTPVSATISGLKTKTTYYFQVVASNAVGTTPGAVLSFTTN